VVLRVLGLRPDRADAPADLVAGAAEASGRGDSGARDSRWGGYRLRLERVTNVDMTTPLSLGQIVGVVVGFLFVVAVSFVVLAFGLQWMSDFMNAGTSRDRYRVKK
jgi:hypothetical protein